MKKFSLLIALVLLVTIGGVYATWNYAQGDVVATQGFVLPKMETVITEGSKGTISVDTSGLTIKVDDSATDSVTHKPVLVMDGEIVITFTAATGADDSVVQNGIKMQAVISCTENWTYKDQQIISVDTADNKHIITTNGAQKTLTISAATLAEIVKMTEHEDLILSTHEEFLNFQTILNRGNIKITVSEVE